MIEDIIHSAGFQFVGATMLLVGVAAIIIFLYNKLPRLERKPEWLLQNRERKILLLTDKALEFHVDFLTRSGHRNLLALIFVYAAIVLLVHIDALSPGTVLYKHDLLLLLWQTAVEVALTACVLMLTLRIFVSIRNDMYSQPPEVVKIKLLMFKLMQITVWITVITVVRACCYCTSRSCVTFTLDGITITNEQLLLPIISTVMTPDTWWISTLLAFPLLITACAFFIAVVSRIESIMAYWQNQLYQGKLGSFIDQNIATLGVLGGIGIGILAIN